MQPDRPRVPDSYGIEPLDQGRIIEWSWAESQLRAARNYWVVTASRSGDPHAAPVWGVWVDSRFYFGTDLQSRKGSNLLENDQIVVHLESGDEVIILEGNARLRDPGDLGEKVDSAYFEKYGIHITGGPVFEVDANKVLAWSEVDYPQSATRWLLE